MQRPCSYMPYERQSSSTRQLIASTFTKVYNQDLVKFKQIVTYKLGCPALFRLDEIVVSSFSVTYSLFDTETLTLQLRRHILLRFAAYYPTAAALAVCCHPTCLCIFASFTQLHHFGHEDLPLLPPGFLRYEAPLVSYPTPDDSIIYCGSYSDFETFPGSSLPNLTLSSIASSQSIDMPPTVIDASEPFNLLEQLTIAEQYDIPSTLSLQHLLKVFSSPNALHFAMYLRQFTQAKYDCMTSYFKILAKREKQSQMDIQAS